MVHQQHQLEWHLLDLQLQLDERRQVRVRTGDDYPGRGAIRGAGDSDGQRDAEWGWAEAASWSCVGDWTCLGGFGFGDLRG